MCVRAHVRDDNKTDPDHALYGPAGWAQNLIGGDPDVYEEFDA